jgi:hypothetical protein
MVTQAITVDPDDLRELKILLKSFNKQKNDRSLKRATSTAVRATKSEAVKKGNEALKTRTKKAVKDSIKSRYSNIDGVVTITGKKIPGHSFRNLLVGKKPKRGSKAVGTQWYADSALKEQPGYFRMRKTKQANSPIIKRKGKARLPTVSLFGPTVFNAMGSGAKGKRRQNKLVEFGGNKYLSEMKRQVDLVLAGK